MSYKKYLLISTLLIALSITFGAFGAHILNPGLEDKYVRTLSTANQYLMVMSVALFALGILVERIPSLDKSFYLILAGVIFFSGSLYIIVLCKYYGSDIPGIVGPITPIGGLLMILGWVWCGWVLVKDKGS